MASVHISIDTEYQPVLNSPTIPISVQMAAQGYPSKFYLHPSVPLAEHEKKHPTFKTPIAPLDFLGLDWRWAKKGENPKDSLELNLYGFFSLKDWQFAYISDDHFRDTWMDKIDRKRRWSTQRNIGTRLVVQYPGKDGYIRDHKVTIKLVDVAAMQGIGGLSEYASNVGILMDTKETYTSEEKGNMLENYRKDPEKFERYAMGDVVTYDIYNGTNEFYNRVAEVMKLAPRSCWGLSTGKVTASMVSEWLANQIGVDVETFSQMTKVAGQEGLTALTRLVRNKDLLYLTMTDGGRAVRERNTDVVFGTLMDIDIDGCYGNGQRNQKFAIGNPTVFDRPQSLREFKKFIERQGVAGLWTARVSCPKMPFAQDLLISKVEEAFTSWENGHSPEETAEAIGDEGEKVYDASMVLQTRELTMAALTHDLLQVLWAVASNHEKSWLLDNVTVESALVYEKRNRVSKVSAAMLEGARCSQKTQVGVEYSKEWIEVDLKDWVEPLIAERKKYPKKHPMNTFFKLLINCTYGVLASSFFSDGTTGCSNVVVASNITARARALGWLMAKGFGSYMTVTDGGVFDVNRVNVFRSKSLNLLEGLHRDIYLTPNDRKRFVDQVPLLGREMGMARFYETVDAKGVPLDKPRHTVRMHDAEGIYVPTASADQMAWQHLQQQFPGVDILDKNQFSFETKDIYFQLTLRSKVDYRLKSIVPSLTTIKVRGLPGKRPTLLGVSAKSIGQRMFDAIENGEPLKEVHQWGQLLSLADWQKHPQKEVLLPHDEVTDEKTFYNLTPLSARYETQADYRKMMKAYEKAKVTGDPAKVAALRTAKG